MKSQEVIREEMAEEDDPLAHERMGLTHQQEEMIVSKSLTDRMLYGCCSTCFLLLATLVLFALLLALFLYVVIQRNDCHDLMPRFTSAAAPFVVGIFLVFLFHILVYLRLSTDFFLLWEIHFCEQNLIKEEVKIRE